MSSKIIRYYSLIFVTSVSFIAGYVIALSFSGTNQILNSCPAAKIDQCSENRLRQRIKESGLLPMSDEKYQITNIYGEVMKVENNKIVVKMKNIDPLADAELDTREVTINENTIFNKTAVKTQEEFQKEIDNYNVKSKNGSLSSSDYAPKMVYLSSSTISDIREGILIEVIADQNIRLTKEFKAKEIIIQPQNENSAVKNQDPPIFLSNDLKNSPNTCGSSTDKDLKR